MAINETLRKIGLSEKEIRLYTAILKSGKIKPSKLSSLTKINRATVYHLAKELISKGLIAADISGKTLYFVPLPPESLGKIITEAKREISEKEALVKKAIIELGLIGVGKEYPVPKLRFVEEGDLEKYLYENFIKWNNDLLKTDATWWGFQDHSLVEHYEKWILWTWNTKEYQNPQIKAKLLSNDSSIEKKMERKLDRTKRDIRFLPGMDFTSSLWVAGDYLIMIATRTHPFYLVEIHDATLAHNMREVFKKLWALTEVMKTLQK